MKTLDILTVELVEWLDNPFKRSQISDKDLAESIEQVGVKQPLAAIKKDGRYLIVDGNRRLRIARKLNIKQLPVNIYDRCYGSRGCRSSSDGAGSILISVALTPCGA